MDEAPKSEKTVESDKLEFTAVLDHTIKSFGAEVQCQAQSRPDEVIAKLRAEIDRIRSVQKFAIMQSLTKAYFLRIGVTCLIFC